MPALSTSAAVWVSLWVSIPPNTQPSCCVGIEDAMLAMSALLIRNGQRVGSRPTKSDGQDSDGLLEQASLKSQPSDQAPASPNAQANRQIPKKTATSVDPIFRKAWAVRQPPSLQHPKLINSKAALRHTRC